MKPIQSGNRFVIALIMLAAISFYSKAKSQSILKADELEGEKASEVKVSNIRVSFSIKPVHSDMGNNWTQPLATVYENNEIVGVIHGAKRPGYRNSAAHVQITNLDESNTTPEVLLSSFTGGAHCCGTVHVLTKNVMTQDWNVVGLGPFDGGTIEAVDPLKGNQPLIVTYDNRFLYQFASYAASAAPAQLWKLTKGIFNDVSKDPIYQKIHLKNIKSLEKTLDNFPYHQRNPNGLLAAYVATKAIVGELQLAWEFMLQRYDSKQEWGLQKCRSGYDKKGRCIQMEIYKSYPEALLEFLIDTGYLSSTNAGDIRSITIK